jgi:5-methylcytosine-specific restriction protein A
MRRKTPGAWKGQRGTTTERGYGWHWQQLRESILSRDCHLCQVCKAADARHVDHITPKAKGGTDDPDNLQAICEACHTVKTDREAAEGQGRRPRPTIGADGWPV